MGAFLDRYIFPGGYLPTVNQLLSSIHAGSQGTLEIETVQSIGPHYIRTLACWREKFLENWETIRASFVSKSPSVTEEEIEAFRRRWVVRFPLHTLLIAFEYLVILIYGTITDILFVDSTTSRTVKPASGHECLEIISSLPYGHQSR